MFEDGVESFKNISQIFIEFIEEVDEFSFLSNVSRIGLPFENDGEIFEPGFFDEITSENTPTKQESIISFMRDTRDNFTNVFNVFRAQAVFYRLTNELYANGTSVSEIFNDVRQSLLSNILPEVQAVAQNLQARDVVCFIAVAHFQDDPFYDFFNLSVMFESGCDVSDEQVVELFNNAQRERLRGSLVSDVQVIT